MLFEIVNPISHFEYLIDKLRHKHASKMSDYINATMIITQGWQPPLTTKKNNDHNTILEVIIKLNHCSQ